MARGQRKIFWGLVALVPVAVAYGWRDSRETKVATAATVAKTASLPPADGMIQLQGGTFLMGTPRPSPDDQRPVHRVVLAPFSLDATHVTNREFAQFVADTDYRTTAEERGESLLFDRKQGNWQEVAGVCWRHPTGADSSLAGKDNYPVVHVSWYDAVAYATWANKRLPSEAEYEFAARGGLSDAQFPWGREFSTGHQLQANYWQGKFPLTNLEQDGYFAVAPTKAFPANPYGLYEMAGNAASWCGDWYAADAYGQSVGGKTTGPETGTERVLRGGSWAATDDKGAGLHVGDRGHAPPEQTSDRVGFRCARDIVN